MYILNTNLKTNIDSNEDKNNNMNIINNENEIFALVLD